MVQYATSEGGFGFPEFFKHVGEKQVLGKHVGFNKHNSF